MVERPGDKDVTDYYRATGQLRAWLLAELDRLGVHIPKSSPHRAATTQSVTLPETLPGGWVSISGPLS
jgi:hypothetical protein